MQRLLNNKKLGVIVLIAGVLFLIFDVVYPVLAVPPGTVYFPGETLDPNCSPSDPNCTVDTPLTSNNLGNYGVASLSGGNGFIVSSPTGTVSLSLDVNSTLTTSTKLGLNLNNANTWLAMQTFSASTTMASTSIAYLESANVVITGGALSGVTGSISMWTNDRGYITSSSAENLTNKTGNISLWTNDIGFVTSSGARVALSSSGPVTYNSSTGEFGWTNSNNYITLASLSGTSPINYNNSTGAISIARVSSTQDGYLSFGDWTTFNNKVSSQWTTTGTNIYYNTGGVMVGTTTLTSGSKLDVVGGSMFIYPASSGGFYVHAYTGASDAASAIRGTNNAQLDIAANALSGAQTSADPMLRFYVNEVGTPKFVVGVDNSDSDKFKISYGTYTPGTNDRLTIDTTGKVGIGTSAPATLLDLNATDDNTLGFSRSSTFYARLGISSASIPTLRATFSGSGALGGYFDIIQAHTNYGFLIHNGSNWGGFGVDSSGNTQISTNATSTDYIIYANNFGTELARFKGTGIAGIGVAPSASYKLNVGGALNATGAITSQTNIAAGGYIDAGTIAYVNTLAPHSASTALTFKNNVGGLATTSTMSLNHDGTLYLGSGTPTVDAGYQFKIEGSTPGFLVKGTTSSGSFGMGFTTSNGFGTEGLKLYYNGNSGYSYFDSYYTNGGMYFRTRVAGTAVNVLTLQPGGQVGINKTAPTTWLDIQDLNATASSSEIMTLRTAYSNNGNQKSFTWRDATNIVGQVGTWFDGTKVNMTWGSLYNSGYNSTDLMTLTGAGNLGIGTTTPAYKFQVYVSSTSEGHVAADGTWANTSDERLKKNILTLDGGLKTTLALRPVYYDPSYFPDNSVTGTMIGFIAQEVQKILPQVVDINPLTGFMSISYAKFTPILVSAIQEQQVQISKFVKFIGQGVSELVELIADKITARSQLCVGETCVNEVQLKQLLNNANNNVVATQSTNSESNANIPAADSTVASSSSENLVPPTETISTTASTTEIVTSVVEPTPTPTPTIDATQATDSQPVIETTANTPAPENASSATIQDTTLSITSVNGG